SVVAEILVERPNAHTKQPIPAKNELSRLPKRPRRRRRRRSVLHRLRIGLLVLLLRVLGILLLWILGVLLLRVLRVLLLRIRLLRVLLWILLGIGRLGYCNPSAEERCEQRGNGRNRSRHGGFTSRGGQNGARNSHLARPDVKRNLQSCAHL